LAHLLALDGLAQLLIDQRAGARSILRLCGSARERERYGDDEGSNRLPVHEHPSRICCYGDGKHNPVM
jgi:hypothetical protein